MAKQTNKQTRACSVCVLKTKMSSGWNGLTSSKCQALCQAMAWHHDWLTGLTWYFIEFGFIFLSEFMLLSNCYIIIYINI